MEEAEAGQAGGRPPPKAMYVVVDRAERLRQIDGAFDTLLRLPELTGVPVCVVLISTVFWDALQGFLAVSDPIQVHFPNYSRETFKAILGSRPVPPILPGSPNPPDYDDLWEPFIWRLTDSFAAVCPELNELDHLARSLFPVFCGPALRGEVDVEDISKLFIEVMPSFKHGFEALYLHQAKEQETATGEMASTVSQVPPCAMVASHVPQVHLQLKCPPILASLPAYAKYMLVAAYLASYLPPKMDLKIFTQLDRSRINRNGHTATEAANVEPKAFTVDRLLAIFHAILANEKLSLTLSPEEHIQVSALESLALLVRVSQGNNLHQIRYKCIAEPSVVSTIATGLDIDLGAYF